MKLEKRGKTSSNSFFKTQKVFC